jgi:Leucine-rich repeat (LRR) protein
MQYYTPSFKQNPHQLFKFFKLKDFDNLPFNEITRLYFTEVGNELPDLNKFVNLESLYFVNTSLISLPNFDKCTKLKHLYCYDNKNLTSLPRLDMFTELKILYCYNNKKLTQLPNLDKCTKLYKLYCNNNNLTSLPNLDKSTKLMYLFCDNNKLTSLPSFDNCNRLRELYCVNNRLTSFPNLNNIWTMEYFHIFSGNNIKKLPYNIRKNEWSFLYDKKKNIPDYIYNKNLPEIVNENVEIYYYKNIMKYYNKWYIRNYS